MSDQTPDTVVPDFLSEMSPEAAWNLALKTFEPLASFDSFWNGGIGIPQIALELLVKEKTDDSRKRRIRFRTGPQRMVHG